MSRSWLVDRIFTYFLSGKVSGESVGMIATLKVGRSLTGIEKEYQPDTTGELVVNGWSTVWAKWCTFPYSRYEMTSGLRVRNLLIPMSDWNMNESGWWYHNWMRPRLVSRGIKCVLLGVKNEYFIICRHSIERLSVQWWTTDVSFPLSHMNEEHNHNPGSSAQVAPWKYISVEIDSVHCFQRLERQVSLP